jgi:hypothetical protein
MAVMTREYLSASTTGRVIPVTAVATPGTTIHTAAATGKDCLFLEAFNVTAAPHTLTIEWGGVLAPGDHAPSAYTIPANSGPYPISNGMPIGNSLVVKAFADLASAINIRGYVDRITP